MRILLVILFIINSFINLFSQNNLPNIQGQILWLRADSVLMNTDSTVYEWKDLSPMHTSVFQADTNHQPIFIDSVLNNNPTIRFNGDQWFNGGDICDISDSGITVFIVGKSINSSGSFIAKSVAAGYTKRYAALYNNEYKYLFHSSTLTNILIPSPPIDSFLIYTDMTNFSILKNKVFMNGLIKDSVNIANYNMNSNYDFLVGAYNNNQGTVPPYSSLNLNGDIAEVIIYDRPLSFEERYHIENYLRFRYFPFTYQTPVDLGVDIYISHGFCDTTIDAGAIFTNYLWSTGDATQTITVNQSGTYSITVTDIFGFESSDTIMVYYPEPVQMLDTAICIGDTLLWNCGMDSSYHFLWSTGDTTNQINIWQQNQYYLQITDSFGCKFYSDTAFVKVDSFPQTTSLGNDTSLCAGVNITLETGNLFTVSYLWSTGDTTQYITIINPDTYSITVTDTLGCIAKDTIQIDIHGQAPVPNFIWQNICLGDSTQIADSSYTIDNSTIVSWQWQLPDTSLMTPNFSYIFADTGSFPVILTVNTDSNCSNTIQKQVTIYSLPIADFSTTQLCTNMSINFSENVNSVDSISSFWWTFGDGSSDSISNPVHQFSAPGNFQVSLNVVSLFGCKDSAGKVLEIKPSPEVDFQAGLACTGQAVTFSNLTTTSPVFPIISWHWDYDDGTVSFDQNPSHTFGDTGIYIISLTAQSVNGCSGTAYDTIRVYLSPVAYFLYDTICENTLFQFMDSSFVSGDSIISWNWVIGDDIQSTDVNPEIYFSTSGYEKIFLTVQTSHQCTDNYSEYVYIFPAPDGDFSFYPEFGTTTTQIAFSSDSGYTCLWNFGDNFTDTGQVVYHFFADTGNFVVTLYSTNDYGCSDTLQKSIMVVWPRYDVMVYDFSVNKTNGYLSFDCSFLNAGPLPLDSLNLLLQITGATNFMEHWSGHLLPGQIGSHTFSTLLPLIDDEMPNAICLQIDIAGQTDATPENNLKCIESGNDFILYSIYPNPADNELFIEFNNPEEQMVTVQIIDKLGKIVFSKNNEKTQKGFNRFNINISQIESGTYTIKIFTNIDNQEKQFMVY